MRIAIWHNLPSGGGKRALFDQVSGLVTRGHHVEAWRPPTADESYLPLAELVKEHIVDLEWPSLASPRGQKDISTLDYATPESFGIKRALVAMDDHCRRCAAEISTCRFDILLAHPCMFFRATAIGRYVDLPSILFLQEPYRWLYEAMPRLRWLAPPAGFSSLSRPWTWRRRYRDWRNIEDARVQAREELTNAIAFDRILVNSYFSRESVLRAYGIDSDVCYLGVDTRRFVNIGRERERFVVGLGSVTPEKNLRLCIEAIGLLPLPRPKLVWIGNVAKREHLAEMQRLAETRGVEFEPRIGIDEAELLETLNLATLMLYAPRLEPFGYAPLEANACGVPVIAVAEGGVRETVIHEANGLVVDNDPRSMASALIRLLDDPSLARRLGDTGRQMVEERWSSNDAIDRLEHHLALVAGTCKNSRPMEVA